MSTQKKFERKFFIFEAVDKERLAIKEPSGYVKTEVRELTAKLEMVVKDLKDDPNGYALYMLTDHEDEVTKIHVGSFKTVDGKATLKRSFESLNVYGSFLPLNRFKTYLIVCHNKDGKKVPLIIAGEKIDFRKYFNDETSPKDATKDKGIEENNNEAIRIDEASNKNMDDDKARLNDYSRDKLFKKDSADKEKEIEAKPQDTNERLKESGEEKAKRIEGAKGETSGKVEERAEETEEETTEEITEKTKQEEIRDMEKEPEKKRCVYGEEQNCEEEYTEETNPCESCYEKKTSIKQENFSDRPPDIEKLTRLFDKNFERINPFGTRRNDYMWWKVNSPVFLNDLLYQCDIKAPLLFNPAVMKAHYSYRYLIVGLYKKRQGDGKYLVCGIPGRTRREKSPFGDLCRFVPLVQMRRNQSVTGYWLVFIDPNTGGPLKIIDS